MKILFVSHQSEFIYGGEIVTLTLIEKLRARGHDLHFALPQGPYFERAKSLANTHPISSIEFSRRLSVLPSLVPAFQSVSNELVKLIDTHHFDAIHATSLKSFCYTALPARRRPVPVLWHHHDIMPNSLKNRLWLRSLSHFADQIAVPSQAAKDALIGAGIKTPIAVVYNGIDSIRFAPRETSTRNPGAPFVVGVVGELSHRKGSDWISEIARGLEQSVDRSFVIQVIGEGLSDPGFAKEVRESAKDLESRGRIEFLGRRNDVAELMRQFDVLLVPSRQDPLPTVVLEAMFSGVPVIGTPVGGIPEMIEPEKTGFLADTLEGFSEAILRLMNDEPMRLTMASAARDVAVSKFSAEAMADQFEKLLNFSRKDKTR